MVKINNPRPPTPSRSAINRGLLSIIVDPDHERRAQLRDILEPQGVVVCEAASVDEAAKQIQALGSPDLLVCEIAVWGQACQEVDAASHPDTDPARPYRVAILQDRKQALHVVADGADDFLIWPNAIEAIEGRLNAILQQASLRVWMDTLRQAGAVVSGAERLDGLFASVASRLRRILPVDHFIVARPENTMVRFEVVDMLTSATAPWTFCLRTPATETCSQRFTESPSGYRICNRVKDNDPRLAQNMRSCLCLPLTSHGRVIGSLSIASRAPQAFEKTITPQLTALAVQVSNAVANIERYEQACSEAERLAAIVREVHHRIKNNLQGVVGLLAEHRDSTPGLAMVLNNAISQLHTIANVHALLSHRTSEQIMLPELLQAIAGHTASLCHHQIEIDMGFAPTELLLPASEAVPFALVVNELMQNAIKHGYPDGRRGTIRISLAEADGKWCLRVANDGSSPGSPQLSATSGLGLELVRAMLPDSCLLQLLRVEGWTVAEVTLCGWLDHNQAHS